jgi:branched-chain amino acid transport system ATP-binding protein
MTPILEARGLEKTFGAVVAAHNINVTMRPGEIVGVIGANGAGKTTFINMVTGYLKPSAGTVHFEGHDVTHLQPREIVRRGLGRSFQIPQLFGTLTARENLLVALGIAAPGGLSFTKRLRRAEMIEQADAALARFDLQAYADTEAKGLPQGVRKVLDVAMATVSRPRLILLDEPTSAISAEEKFAVMATLMRALGASKVTVLFVEHDMDIVARHAQRVIAFYDGTIIADAPPEQALANDEVKKYVIGEKVA